MKIRELKSEELDKYDELAAQYGTVFHRISWLKAITNVRPLGIFNNGNELVGGLLVSEKKKFCLKILQSADFAGAINPFYKEVTGGHVTRLEARRDIVQAIVDYIRDNKFSIVSLPLSPEMVDVLPFVWDDYKMTVRYTYRLNLMAEDPLSNVSSKMRKHLNKAEKEGLTCEKVNDMNILYKLICKTYARQNIGFDETHVKRVLFEFANGENSFAFAAFREGTPIAASFVVHNGRMAHSIFSGYDSDKKSNAAGPLVRASSIRHAKEIGCKIFDFEGSVIPRIEEFFRGFGGELTPYYVANKAWLPLEMLLKFFKRRLF